MLEYFRRSSLTRCCSRLPFALAGSTGSHASTFRTCASAASRNFPGVSLFNIRAISFESALTPIAGVAMVVTFQRRLRNTPQLVHLKGGRQAIRRSVLHRQQVRSYISWFLIRAAPSLLSAQSMRPPEVGVSYLLRFASTNRAHRRLLSSKPRILSSRLLRSGFSDGRLRCFKRTPPIVAGIARGVSAPLA